MKIFTEVVMRWDKTLSQYVTVSSQSYEHDGPVALACGATSAQNDIQQQQSQFSQQLAQQATQVFGQDSKVFGDLISTFAPTIAAGPNQEGFSAAEKANLNSQAITETGQAYKNAKAAVGNAQAASGGGNNPNVSSGTEVGEDLDLASSAANQTSGELSQITQADYATGRQNYQFAAEGLEKAPSVFDSATSAANATTGAQEGAANTANQIAQENQSWMQAASGALGAVAGAAAGFSGAAPASPNPSGIGNGPGDIYSPSSSEYF